MMKSLEYLAGFFDGEGSVGVYPTKNTTGVSYGLQVTVANTYLPILREFQEQFGGHIGRISTPTTSQKQRYQWQLRGGKACTFLTAITPHLVEKRPQAEVAFTIQSRTGKPMTPEYRAQQEAIYLEVKRLKHIA